MPRRKKHLKLPNGYGSISYLGKNRRRPWGVYPPASTRINGKTVRPQALGYCETYEDARELLALYHKGIGLPDVLRVKPKGLTFVEVYEKFMADKFENAGKPLSLSTAKGYRAAYQNSAELHDRDFGSISYPELQAVLDACPLSAGSVSLMVKLFHGMWKYAVKYELTDKDPSQHLEIRKADTTEHGVPFTIDEIKRIAASPDPVARQMLVMIYSGYRVSAYRDLEVHTAPDWYFRGGVKTASGKNRVVPIHTGIRPFVNDLFLKNRDTSTFRKSMARLMTNLGMDPGHTPHDCRHTFSALCEKYGVPEADRKRLMGHSFGGDITNGVYGHRTVEELRESIQLIPGPDAL